MGRTGDKPGTEEAVMVNGLIDHANEWVLQGNNKEAGV